MIDVHEGLGLLGMKVHDRVTGADGVVTSIAFDLYGCVQALVNPGLGSDGRLRELVWLDVARLDTTSENPVMRPPEFTPGSSQPVDKGPEEKPTAAKY